MNKFKSLKVIILNISRRLTGIILAIGTITPRWLLMRWPSAQVVGWAMLIGGIAIVLICQPTCYFDLFDIAACLSLVYICILGTAVAFWAYVTSIKYILPQEASILNATELLASIVFSVLLLNVNFQLPEIIGTILIIIPVLYITTRKNK